MKYDLVVVGATFAGLGAYLESDGNALIIERRAQIGYEFLNTYTKLSAETDPRSKTAQEFYSAMQAEGLSFQSGDLIPFLYQTLKEENILLMTEILHVEKIVDGYRITVYGAEGQYTIDAGHIIDTTEGLSLPLSLRPEITAKSLSAVLLRSEGQPFTEYCKNGVAVTAFRDNLSLLTMKLNVSDSYQDGRQKLHSFWIKHQLSGHVIGLISDCFDIKVQSSYESISDHYQRLTSFGFESPVKAFEAGVSLVRGGE